MTPGRVKSLPVLISLLIPLLTAVLIAVFLAAVVDASNRRMPVATLVESSDLSPTVQEAQPSPEEIMAARPLAPTNLDWQNQNFYPEAPNMAPAPLPAPSAAEVRDMLTAYLERQFPGDSAAQADAMALFDQVSVRQKVPDPTLRAALVGLKGTIGEPAIDTILNATIPGPSGTPIPLVTSISFVSFLPPGSIAQASGNPNTGQMTILVNSHYRAENPFLFTGILAHEAGHIDPTNGTNEEMILKTFETLIHLELLAKHPELAQDGHELSRILNTQAMVLLNSGLGAHLGLYAGNGPVLPDSNQEELTSFRAFWEWFYSLSGPINDRETPGNPLLNALMAALGLPGEWNYNRETLAAIDAALQAGQPFDAEMLVDAAKAMGLDIGDAGPPPVGDYRVYVAVICR